MRCGVRLVVHMLIHIEAQGDLVNVMGIIRGTIELIAVTNCKSSRARSP